MCRAGTPPFGTPHTSEFESHQGLDTSMCVNQKYLAAVLTACMHAHMTKHASKGSTLTLTPRADITRCPKQGCQWPHKKTHVLQMFEKKALQMRYQIVDFLMTLKSGLGIKATFPRKDIFISKPSTLTLILCHHPDMILICLTAKKCSFIKYLIIQSISNTYTESIPQGNLPSV